MDASGPESEEGRSAFEALKKQLAIAIEQADHGELEDVDDGLADRVRAAGKKKLEAWRNANGV
jgi:hypothetical protein